MQSRHFLAWALTKIWLYDVTQVENLSFSYSKSYSPISFGKSHQILWFCCTQNGSYKEDNLKRANKVKCLEGAAVVDEGWR